MSLDGTLGNALGRLVVSAAQGLLFVFMLGFLGPTYPEASPATNGFLLSGIAQANPALTLLPMLLIGVVAIEFFSIVVRLALTWFRLSPSFEDVGVAAIINETELTRSIYQRYCVTFDFASGIAGIGFGLIMQVLPAAYFGAAMLQILELCGAAFLFLFSGILVCITSSKETIRTLTRGVQKA